MTLYNIPIGFKIFAVINLHQRNDTLKRFLQYQKLLVASSSFIDFKVMPTNVTNHYKFTIHLTFSEGILFVSLFEDSWGVHLIIK